MGMNLSIGPEESPPGLGSSAKNQQNWFLDSSVGESGVFFYKRPSGLGEILILVTWSTETALLLKYSSHTHRTQV